MTVKAVWGRIQRQNATLAAHEGDVWTFDVPLWASSPIIAEFWAEDDAGNVSYRAGVFALEEGTIKCIRWRTEGSSLTMLADDRPVADMLDVGRPCIVMEAHACSRLIEVGI